jgi:uncharacterized membrane protein YqhA
MKTTFNILKKFIRAIAVLVFLSGIVLTILGIFDMGHALWHFVERDDIPLATSVGVGMLKAIDMFLVAIVFFVFSLGILMLFNNKPPESLPDNLPKWLHIKNFMELKVILWEAILTTMLVSFLSGAVERKMIRDPKVEDLIVPAAILIIALSLYLLKKGESKKEL